MTRLLGAAALFAVVCSPAVADEKYDRSIDEAAARILAGRMGDIRGSFAPDANPLFVSGAEEHTGSTGPARNWPKGLVRARDPLVAVNLAF